MSQLNVIENKKLRSLERTIESGLKSFVEVGQALAEIRDSKLYRDSHESFDAYCRDRWQLAKSRAHQLINAAVVSETVSTNGGRQIDNERQARELAALPADQQPEAWQEVLKETAKPTAAKVREVVERKQSKVADVERDRDSAKSFHQRGGDDCDDEPAEAETIHSFYSEFLELWNRADEPARAMIRIFVMEEA